MNDFLAQFGILSDIFSFNNPLFTHLSLKPDLPIWEAENALKVQRYLYQDKESIVLGKSEDGVALCLFGIGPRFNGVRVLSLPAVFWFAGTKGMTVALGTIAASFPDYHLEGEQKSVETAVLFATKAVVASLPRQTREFLSHPSFPKELLDLPANTSSTYPIQRKNEAKDSAQMAVDTSTEESRHMVSESMGPDHPVGLSRSEDDRVDINSVVDYGDNGDLNDYFDGDHIPSSASRAHSPDVEGVGSVNGESPSDPKVNLPEMIAKLKEVKSLRKAISSRRDLQVWGLELASEEDLDRMLIPIRRMLRVASLSGALQVDQAIPKK